MTSLPKLGAVTLVAVAAAVVVACGGTLGVGESGCPSPSPGLCAPSIACTDGFVRTGAASCVDGAWVCAEAPCANDGGADTSNDGSIDGGCSGSSIPVCVGGRIGAGCCPAGAPCVAPEPFCDLGGGDCTRGTCATDAGCSKGSLSASNYLQTCTVDGDCVGIFQGSACGACFCPNATINRASLAQYQADFAARDPGPGICDCPTFPSPTCAAGICTTGR